MITDALPGLTPPPFHSPTEPTHLKEDFARPVAPKKLLPRELLLAVVVLWLAPFIVAFDDDLDEVSLRASGLLQVPVLTTVPTVRALYAHLTSSFHCSC